MTTNNSPDDIQTQIILKPFLVSTDLKTDISMKTSVYILSFPPRIRYYTICILRISENNIHITTYMRPYYELFTYMRKYY